jgi:hypothetical protein
MRRLVVGALAMLLLAGCGGGAKTTSTAAETETTSNAARAAVCLDLDEAVVAWVGQVGHVLRPNVGTNMGAALTQADEESYRVEKALKSVTVAVPGAKEAATRFLSTIDAVRTALSEGDEDHAAGALAEVKASSGPIIAACHG